MLIQFMFIYIPHQSDNIPETAEAETHTSPALEPEGYIAPYNDEKLDRQSNDRGPSSISVKVEVNRSTHLVHLQPTCTRDTAIEGFNGLLGWINNLRDTELVSTFVISCQGLLHYSCIEPRVEGFGPKGASVLQGTANTSRVQTIHICLPCYPIVHLNHTRCLTINPEIMCLSY